MDSILITLKWVSNFIIQISVYVTWICAAILVLIYSVIFLRILVYIFNRFIREDSPQNITTTQNNNYIPMVITSSRVVTDSYPQIQTPHRSQMRILDEEEEEDWEEVCFRNADAV